MLLGGNSSFLAKLIIPPLIKEEMRPASSTPPLVETEDEDIHSFPTSSSETDRKIELLRNVVGEDFPIDRIKHVLHGADGDVEIALNHLFNDLEKEKPVIKSESSNTHLSHSNLITLGTPTVSRSPSTNSLTPTATEKLLYDLAEEVKCPLCLGYFNNPINLPCFHSFCSTCVEDMRIHITYTFTYTFLVTSDDKLTCPMCRNVVALDERGVRGLKQNHYLANIVEKLKSAQNTKMCGKSYSLFISHLSI